MPREETEPTIIPNPPDDETSHLPDAPDPAEQRIYFVLKAGEILGPLTFRKLVTFIAAKTITKDDLVQEGGSHEWVPVRWVLDPKDGPREEGATAPTWRTLLSWAWMRLRYNLDEQSLPAGLVCLGASVLGLLLSQWPAVFWIPWAVLAFLAGASLHRRGKSLPGVLLMLAAAAIPGTLWAFFWRIG